MVILLPTNLRGRVENPYIGLLLFIAIPIVFFVGLALIPIGIMLAKRRIAAKIGAVPDRASAFRRAGIFFAVMTFANVIIGSQLSYRAVEHMDTAQFCGQSCHVMKPEFTAHQRPPHEGVACASCHIAPGATGWLHAKMAGTHQLISVIFNTFRARSNRRWRIIGSFLRRTRVSSVTHGNGSSGRVYESSQSTKTMRQTRARKRS